MKSGLMRKFGQSLLRIAAALAVVPGIPALIYLFWQPGSDEPLPEYSGNAIWIGHGWLGDDGWFARNRRDKADCRSEEKIAALFRNLSDNHVSTVYPHLCPAQMNGTIAPYDNSQLGRFPDVAENTT